MWECLRSSNICGDSASSHMICIHFQREKQCLYGFLLIKVNTSCIGTNANCGSHETMHWGEHIVTPANVPTSNASPKSNCENHQKSQTEEHSPRQLAYALPNCQCHERQETWKLFLISGSWSSITIECNA
jgi:hypothetical protein